MKSRDLAFLLVGAVGAGAALAAMLALVGPGSRAKVPPTVAGQPVPAQHIELNFSNRFNVYTRNSASNQVWLSCLFVGFTGQPIEDRGFSSDSRYSFFRQWLVLEPRSGRRVYLRPESVDYIEDADD